MNFKGKARRIDDYDLPRLGALIGVGEDELHAFMDVEAAGSGFDSQGRPKMLFEPHLFYRELGAGPKRDEAVKQGLAYAKWKTGSYPKESYTRIAKAMKIDAEAALRSASWGLTQILGKWHKDIGYPTAKAMVEAFADDEAKHLEATIALLKQWGVDDDLKAHRWATVAKAWNGEAYATHGYHTKLANAYAKWAMIPDTAWPPKGWTPPETATAGPLAPVKPVKPSPVPNPTLPPAATDAGATKDTDVVLVDGPKKDETQVVIVTTPKPDLQKPAARPSKTGLVAIFAMIAAIIAGAIKYFGG